MPSTELTRVTGALARALSIDDVDQIGRETGQSERLRTITPSRLFLSIVAALASRTVESLADLLREFNHQIGVGVAYKAFCDQPNEIPQLLPKLYVPLPNSGKAFPDFALGQFRADQQLTVVTAELKSPGANLDASQGGQYQGQTPVQQAMQAASAAGNHVHLCDP